MKNFCNNKATKNSWLCNMLIFHGYSINDAAMAKDQYSLFQS